MIGDSNCSSDLPRRSNHLQRNGCYFIVLDLIDLHDEFRDDSNVDLQGSNCDFQISSLLDVAACVSFSLASVHAACPIRCRACFVCVGVDFVGAIDLSV